MNNKKLIIFASFAPSLLNFHKDLIKSFLVRGFNVVALAPKNTITLEFNEEFQKVFPEVSLHVIAMNAHGMNPFKDIKSFIALIRFFKKERPDYLFSYTIKPVIYGSLAAKIARVPYIFSMITGLGTTFLVRNFRDRCIHHMVKWLYKIALTNNSMVIFQNPDDQVLFINKKIVKAEKTALVAGSGVNVEHFSVVPLPIDLTFIFVGRLIIDKGVVEFIEAAKLVKQDYPHIKIIILGGMLAFHPRALDERILRAARDDGVIEYIPEVKDVRSYLAAASVLVLPSYREGVPRSALEAMSMGRPVIVTDVPGCREVVVDGHTGFKVPVKNVHALKAAMLKFIQDPSLCITMGVAARAMVEQRFKSSVVNEQVHYIMGLK
jgi:glycosyltransferase involved in cell wall biosynthesis